jgi:hypothetical protein
LYGSAFRENAQTIPQTRHSVGLAFVVVDSDMTKKGAVGKTNLMADRS